MRSLLVAAGSLVLAVTALAAPGDLDRSWGGGDGVVRTRLSHRPPLGGGATAALVQGRIVVAGTTTGDGGRPEPFVLRYTLGGRLDRSYRESGVLRGWIPLFGGNWIANRIEPDGRIVITGWSVAGPERGFVGRLLRDGRLDTSFGRGGRTELRAGRCGFDAHTVIGQPDGRLVLSLRSCDDDRLYREDRNWDFARLLPDGTLDQSFGNGGFLRIAAGVPGGLESPYTGQASELLRLRDGTLLAGGGVRLGNDRHALGVVRLTADGHVDREFGINGFLLIPVRSFNPVLADLLLRKDGTVFMSGCTDPNGYEEGIVAAFRGDGSRVGSWGHRGVWRTDRALSCGRLAERSDRKLFMLSPRRLGLLTPKGRLDRSFGDRGLVKVRVRGALNVVDGTDALVTALVPLPGQKSGVAIFRYDGR